MSDHYNLLKIFRLTSGEEGELPLIRSLMDIGVLPAENVLKCPRGHPLTLRKDDKTYKWYCKAYITGSHSKPKKCQYSQSIRKGTFFEKSHLSITSICMFVNLWVDNVKLKTIGKQVGIKATHTLVDWSSFCREVVFDATITNMEPIGGVGKIVEIDESKFGKRKYHRGHRVEGQWVFGGIERESGKCFLVPVEKRDRETLIPIIKKHILPGTTIMSDCWRPYDVLGQEGYNHLKVNHSIEYVDSTTGACTNRIESTWRAAKHSYEVAGRRKYFFAGYLAKYMFFKRVHMENLDPYVEFLKSAGRLYNPLIVHEASEDEDSDEESEVDLDDHET